MDELSVLQRRVVERHMMAVCSYYGSRPRDILRRDRRFLLVEQRQLLMYLLYRDAGLSSPTIGLALQRDHSTVLYGVHRVERMIALSPDLAFTVACLRQILRTPVALIESYRDRRS